MLQADSTNPDVQDVNGFQNTGDVEQRIKLLKANEHDLYDG